MKRYNISKLLGRMVTMDDGEWVKYEDAEKLKELNRELLHILQWLIRLRDGYLKKGSTAPNSAGEYNEAMEQARELLAKAEEEG